MIAASIIWDTSPVMGQLSVQAILHRIIRILTTKQSLLPYWIEK
jgi:hypothetical protein